MVINDFNQLKKNVISNDLKTAVVASAHDEHTLEAVLKASNDGVIRYLLVGNKNKIIEIGEELGYAINKACVVDADSEEESAFKAVEAIRNKEADFVVKGMMQTGTLLKAVVNKETGIGIGGVMSHVAILDIPTYHKLLAITDGGMLIKPSLQQKRDILNNAVRLFNNLGYEKPKVGVLCSVESVNPKMQETIDAAMLKDEAEKGNFGSCYVEGPISFDLATDKQVVKIKKFNSPVAGDADILLVPEITTGNAVSKALYGLGGAIMAGCVIGAKAPIALNSRGASFEEKYYSIILCAKLAE